MMSLNRTALVTGGSRGIGAECVRELTRRGYQVAFTYKSSDESAAALAEETGALAIKCDVADGAAVSKIAETLKENGLEIGVLINNAGISLIKLFTDTTEAEWDTVFDVNIKGMFLVTKALLPAMINAKWGRIINISSMWGTTGGSCEVAYSASKAAVIGFTKALAKEEGPSGITVNCIAPGVIMTEMNAELSEDDLAELADETPLMRLGTAADVAKAAAFLAGEDAAFVTGQVVGVDGGIAV